MDSNSAKNKIKILVDKYLEAKSAGQLNKYSEEETKKGFIEPLFTALGWDISDKNEVTAEESQLQGRVDYGFYLDGRIKFYLEAKSLKADLYNEDYAKQAIRYSWNKGVDWAVLTDFESLKIFYCQDPSQSLFSKLVFELPFSEYLDRFDQLWLLSKESFQEGGLDIYAQEHGKKMQKVLVSDQLYKHLNECRQMLIEKLGLWNGIKDQKLLDEGVQKLLDRLIFIRVAEDRGIEPPTLIPLLRFWENNKNGKSLYESMVGKFRELDSIYNSNLFTEHPFEKWNESPGVTEKVIETFQGKASYYEYDFKVMPADVLGAVYENYLGHRLAQSQKGMTLDKNDKKRKEQGIYYTPSFVVDYIVRNALKPVLDKCRSINDLQKIKVLDPACGSGSFLIKVLEVISEQYKKFGSQVDEFTKIMILQQNIYGVDLDEQAVEITRLNLLLNILEINIKLPKLDKNIKNGNSLISGSDEELEKYFGKNFRDKKPFKWEEEFPEVFKQGGFDVIIGNPPYIRVQTLQENELKYFGNHYTSAQGSYDLYILFVEQSIKLLNNGGSFGMIIPNKFLNNEYGRNIRELLRQKRVLSKLLDFGSLQLFNQVTTYTCLLFLENAGNEKFEYAGQEDLLQDDPQKSITLNKIHFQEISIGNLDPNNWVLGNNSTTKLMSKIKDNHKSLEESTERIFQGLKTGCDSVYIVDILTRGTNSIKIKTGGGKIYTLEPQLFHTLIKGTEMRSFNTLNSNRIILFPYDHLGKLLEPEELEEKYPNTYNYLLENKSLLSKREYGKFDGKFFYQYSRNQALEVISKRKIITPDLAPSARFAIDNSGSYFFTGGAAGGYGIMLKSDIDIYNLLGLLNSKTLDWYLKNISSKFRGGFFSYESRFIKQLPISSQNSLTLNALVKKIINLHGELKSNPKNSNKWESLRNEIEKTNKKIDVEVYNLYGLTPEEIAVVEGCNEN